MKQLLLICAVVALVGCGKKPLTKEESAKVIEAAIRKDLRKSTGELTKADYEKVTKLLLFNNRLTDVKGLEKLNKLTELNLWRNQLTDVKGLEKLTQLTKLWLSDNQLTNVKGLEKLTKLENLYLSKNQLTNVNGLEKLTWLENLDLRDNPDLTKAQIDELEKALPKCRIIRIAPQLPALTPPRESP
jgi:Leucine-rich repeat (LRR) protein